MLVSPFFWTLCSLTPLPYRNPGGWGSFSFSTSSEHRSLPSSLSCPGFQDLLERTPCAFVSGTSPVKGLYWFFHVPQGILVSLFSSFLYTFFSTRPTNPGNGLCHSTSLHLPRILTDPVAQGSSDSTPGRHRLSFFLGSRGTLRSKGPLGEVLGGCPSFFQSLSLCPVKRLDDDFSSRPGSR